MKPDSRPEDAEARLHRVHGYETARPDVLQKVPLNVRRVLELGCSTGAFGAALKARQPAVVVGVEVDPKYAAEARERLDRVVVDDAQAFLEAADADDPPFDCLVAADVLEHLADPWLALDRAAALLTPDATIVLSVPNVLQWRGLRRLLRTRRWPRDDQGLFDRTHLRWFTRLDALDLLRGAGFMATSVSPGYWDVGWRLRLTRVLARTALRDFLPYQYLIVGTKQTEGSPFSGR